MIVNTYRWLLPIMLMIVTVLPVCGKSAYVIPVNDEINSTSLRVFNSGMSTAVEKNADVVILHLNTYGGAVDAADSIRTKIMKSAIPVVAFVDDKAISAGALIALACDSVYMRQGGSMGAASVVNGQGELMPDKYQSFMRSLMRATAESHGKVMCVTTNGDTVEQWRRDPRIAEAMVGSNDSASVLSFTADEAIAAGYCEGKAENVEHVVASRLGMGDDCVIETYQPTIIDILLGFLSNPAVQAVLIMLIVGGIYFELQSPGIGFALLVAIVAAALYFAPLYLEGFAAMWEIIVFVAGIILLLLELFVIPGFGIAGISGIVCIIVGLIAALLGNNDLNFEMITSDNIMDAILIVLSGVLLGVVVVLYISHKIGSKGIMRKSALIKEQRLDEGYIGVPAELGKYVGKTGVACTVLRPGGKIKVGNDTLDAVSMSGFIEQGTAVKVMKYENAQLYVEPAD